MKRLIRADPPSPLLVRQRVDPHAHVEYHDQGCLLTPFTLLVALGGFVAGLAGC